MLDILFLLLFTIFQNLPYTTIFLLQALMQDLIAHVQLQQLKEAMGFGAVAHDNVERAQVQQEAPAPEVEIGAMRVVVDDVDLEVH